jgi:hypothetical protein
MQNWDEIVKSGAVPQRYVDATSGRTGTRSEHFFKDVEPETADKLGQKLNQHLRTARGNPDEDTHGYMKKTWGWSDEELSRASSFFHTAPSHARPHIEVNGLRANLTSTVGDPHEMKQRYGVFGNPHKAEHRYGIEASHPDENGVRKADIYHVKIPASDVRIDPYGYPFAERTVKPHEFKRVGHVTQVGDEAPKVCNHPEEECRG